MTGDDKDINTTTDSIDRGIGPRRTHLELACTVK